MMILIDRVVDIIGLIPKECFMKNRIKGTKREADLIEIHQTDVMKVLLPMMIVLMIVQSDD